MHGTNAWRCAVGLLSTRRNRTSSPGVVAEPTQEAHKSNLHQIRNVTAVRHRLTPCRPNKLALGSGSGAARRCKRWTCWGRTACSLGTLDRDASKGADEQSSRRAPGSLVDPGVCVWPVRRAIFLPNPHLPVGSGL